MIPADPQEIQQEIARLLIEVANADTELTRISYERDMVEAVIALELLSQKDDAGKPVFSNDKARDYAITATKYANPEYKNFNDQYIETYRKRQCLLAEVESLKLMVRLSIGLCLATEDFRKELTSER